MTLGRIVLQRTPFCLYSTATADENASTAAFDVAYPAAPGNGDSAARAATHTTAPPPAAMRRGIAAWVTRYVGRRLRVSMRSNSAYGVSCTRPPTA
jgi:hypothetical protein